MIEHHPRIKEFPELRELIHELKVSDEEFRATRARFERATPSFGD